MRFAPFLFPLIFCLAVLAACTTTPTYHLNAFYAPVPNEEFPVSAVDTSVLNVRNLRQVVPYNTPHAPGTVIVDTKSRFLYLVQEDGKAIRYGVGVGREGMEFSGNAVIHHKRRWPSWTPTPDMIARDPGRYRPYTKGMPGGPTNPLGARALYLFKDGKDTLFRIHGTTEPWSIGQASSSGCIRMINQDVIDLYERVDPGTKVIVL